MHAGNQNCMMPLERAVSALSWKEQGACGDERVQDYMGGVDFVHTRD